jgi:hypothetical protein
VRTGNEAAPQILVKWGNLPDDAAIWEDYYVLQRRFPLAPIWEGAASQGEANVTHSPLVMPDQESPVQDGLGNETAVQEGPPVSG